MKKVLILSLMLVSTSVFAEHVDCKGAYVGRISIDKGTGLNRVVFKSGQLNSSGSYWVYFHGWQPDAKKEVLSILMAAKASGHRVDVYTEAEDGCSIGYSGQNVKELHLSNNP